MRRYSPPSSKEKPLGAHRQKTFERRTTAELAASGVPILFIAGEDDVLFEPSSIRAVSEATAGSRYIEIAGAGHSAYFERPREFNRAVLAFMAKMGPASGT